MRTTASSNSVIKLDEIFDGVIFLESENYCSKQNNDINQIIFQFASLVPVFIVELTSFSEILYTTPKETNIHNVSIPIPVTAQHIQNFLQQLSNNYIKRPLIWVNDTKYYKNLLEALSQNFIVYNITQNFCESKSIADKHSHFFIEQEILNTLNNTDFLIARSSFLLNEIKNTTNYTGPSSIMKTGVDIQGFLEFFKNNNPSPLAKRVIFQGNINQNLDFELLHQLIHLLPDWEFVFCGSISENNIEWNILKTHQNVIHRGVLPQDILLLQLCTAMVAFMPYLCLDWLYESTPLHIQDYLAAGLQVVSTPIKGLEDFPNVHIAKDAKTFAEELLKASKHPRSPESAMPKEFSNEKIFSDIIKNILQAHNNLIHYPKQLNLNILVLYCDRCTFIETVREYIESFSKFSNHNIMFLPVTNYYWASKEFAAFRKPFEESVDFSVFDAVIIHYSVRLSLVDYFKKEIADKVAAFNGVKVLFIQDEYENTEIARKWMDKLQFDFVYTVVPEEFIEIVYPASRFPKTIFFPVLTGYLPENPALDHFSKPMEERTVYIAFRGRTLPFIYGELGQEKYRIGVDVKKFALEKNIPVDIEVTDNKRIYGLDWYRFIGSSRATLGTESGSNIFDFDGSIQKKIDAELKKNPSISFKKIFDMILKGEDGKIKMNQISPRIFEAIRLRTALILFEGRYSGIIQPDTHYIPLKKDYSNINEVFNKLNDLKYLKKLTNRAYKDIVENEKYTYKKFVEKVMKDIESRILKGPKYSIYLTPAFAQCTKTKDLRKISIDSPLSATLSTHVIDNLLLKRETIITFNENSSPSRSNQTHNIFLDEKVFDKPLEPISTPSLGAMHLSRDHKLSVFFINILFRLPFCIKKKIIGFISLIKKILIQFFPSNNFVYVKLYSFYKRNIMHYYYLANNSTHIASHRTSKPHMFSRVRLKPFKRIKDILRILKIF